MYIVPCTMYILYSRIFPKCYRIRGDGIEQAAETTTTTKKDLGKNRTNCQYKNRHMYKISKIYEDRTSIISVLQCNLWSVFPPVQCHSQSYSHSRSHPDTHTLCVYCWLFLNMFRIKATTNGAAITAELKYYNM